MIQNLLNLPPNTSIFEDVVGAVCCAIKFLNLLF